MPWINSNKWYQSKVRFEVVVVDLEVMMPKAAKEISSIHGVSGDRERFLDSQRESQDD